MDQVVLSYLRMGYSVDTDVIIGNALPFNAVKTIFVWANEIILRNNYQNII